MKNFILIFRISSHRYGKVKYMYYGEDHRRPFLILFHIDTENLPPISGNPVPIPLYDILLY